MTIDSHENNDNLPLPEPKKELPIPDEERLGEMAIVGPEQQPTSVPVVPSEEEEKAERIYRSLYDREQRRELGQGDIYQTRPFLPKSHRKK